MEENSFLALCFQNGGIVSLERIPSHRIQAVELVQAFEDRRFTQLAEDLLITLFREDVEEVDSIGSFPPGGQSLGSEGFQGTTVGLQSTPSQTGIDRDAEPGCPQQNGRHERMHRTLKEATAQPPRANLAAQQKAFEAFRREYNEERPHESLGPRPPALFYQPAAREYPCRLPEQRGYPDE